MQNTLKELPQDPYPEWAVYHKRILAAVIEHYMNRDPEKFRRVWELLVRWSAEEDETRATFNVKGEAENDGKADIGV